MLRAARARRELWENPRLYERLFRTLVSRSGGLKGPGKQVKDS